MKVIVQNKNIYIVRFDKDEEVISALTDFCSTNKISAGSFSAIGAAKEVVVAYYNLEKKKYQDMIIEEDVEIISMLGNIATMDGKVIIHAHGSFSDEMYDVRAGHVKKLIVSATCEVTLHVFTGKIERAFDEETGLNLMK